MAVLSGYIPEKSIRLALVPMFTVLMRLAYADMRSEHDLLGLKPEGH